jgi:hypothetical protein
LCGGKNAAPNARHLTQTIEPCADLLLPAFPGGELL